MEAFLIYLAQHANPTRFTPFPDEYRKKSPDDAKSSTNEAKGLGSSFAPYTPEEYADMKKDLDQLAKDPIRFPTLRKYINKLELGMSEHGNNTIHSSITEYEFRYSQLEERIRDIQYRNRWYLFHGSPLGNWHSILRNGLRNMSNTAYMSTGAAYGSGVYLSDNLQVSYSYGGHGKSCCVSVVEVLADPEQYKKADGYFVIPDDKLLVVRYLYRINHRPDFTGKEALAYYKKWQIPEPGIIKYKHD
jgi:hypothetical protein